MNGQNNFDSVVGEINEKGKAFLYTKGRSRLPMLKEGRDISGLVPPARELKRGDVVLFVRRAKDNKLVLHRIIKARDDSFIIRGDNTYFDEPVLREDILAMLDGFFRKGRFYSCKKSVRYRVYSALRMFFYPLRKLVRKHLRIALAKVKNNVLHLNNFHLDDILHR